MKAVPILVCSGVAFLTGASVTAAAETARLRLTITENGVPVPARVHFGDPDGQPVRAPGLPFFNDHFNCEGEVELDLPPGEYRYTIERGPEYRRASGAVTLTAGATVHRDVALERRIDMAARGWWSGETHVHRRLEDVSLLMRSEDLHVAPVLTIWNQRNLWRERPLPDRLLVEVEPTRVYHVLACEDERQGGALFFLNLTRPLSLDGDGPEYPSPLKHLQEALEQPGAWIDIEKPFWWDVPTWVATGKVRSIGIANNHMCRSRMYESEAWGRPRDTRRLPAPRGNGFHSQEIYYRLLNCGFRLPPSAGSASGVLPNPVGYNRAYVHLDGEFSYDAWWRGLAAGRSFVTNGPMLFVEANGRLPGETFKAERGESRQVHLDVRVEGNDPLAAVEVIRDGEVVQRIELDGERAWVTPRPLVFRESGWFLVRVLADVPETFRFASSAPFHVEVGERAATIRASDVRYFVAWIDERIEIIRSGKRQSLSGEQLESVLEPHRRARAAFEGLLESAAR